MITNPKSIPEEWIKEHVDKLLDMASKFDNNSPMREACLLRAEYYMDLVKAWRDHNA